MTKFFYSVPSVDGKLWGGEKKLTTSSSSLISGDFLGIPHLISISFFAKNGRTQGKNVILFTQHSVKEIQAQGLEKDVFVGCVTCVGPR